MDIPPYSPTGELEQMRKNYKVYPVPASQKIMVEVSDEIAVPGMILEIISSDGKPVLTAEIEPMVVNEVSITNLKPGKYFLRVDGISAGTFVKTLD